MVLFTEAETLLLLDLYLRLRLWPRNVASNGVLLRAPARAELTRAINRAAGHNAGRAWTGTFVCCIVSVDVLFAQALSTAVPRRGAGVCEV